jgi:hypothetical protein
MAGSFCSQISLKKKAYCCQGLITHDEKGKEHQQGVSAVLVMAVRIP